MSSRRRLSEFGEPGIDPADDGLSTCSRAALAVLGEWLVVRSDDFAALALRLLGVFHRMF